MSFTSANAVQNAVLSAQSRNRSAPKMLKKMQDRLMKDVLDAKTEPREAAQCALAWDKLEARLAVLSGLPANTSQSIRAETPKKSRRGQSPGATAPIESEHQEPEPPSTRAPVHPTDQQPDNVTDARGTDKPE